MRRVLFFQKKRDAHAASADRIYMESTNFNGFRVVCHFDFAKGGTDHLASPVHPHAHVPEDFHVKPCNKIGTNRCEGVLRVFYRIHASAFCRCRGLSESNAHRVVPHGLVAERDEKVSRVGRVGFILSVFDFDLVESIGAANVHVELACR